MAILEIGICLDTETLFRVEYHPSLKESEEINFEEFSALKAKFFNALEHFILEVFGDKIESLSLGQYKLICFSKEIENNSKENIHSILFYYAVVEDNTKFKLIKKMLMKIDEYFLNRYSLALISSKTNNNFKEFETRVNEIVGDLKINSQERFQFIL